MSRPWLVCNLPRRPPFALQTARGLLLWLDTFPMDLPAPTASGGCTLFDKFLETPQVTGHARRHQAKHAADIFHGTG